jgi:hypothetical protein
LTFSSGIPAEAGAIHNARDDNARNTENNSNAENREARFIPIPLMQ